jgi:DNA-binding NtrC family response regulator
VYHSPILIVEDEAIIGMALSHAVQQAGGEVVGPASTVKAALNFLQTRPISGAILDVNLADGVVTPLVERLRERGIPLIIQTAYRYPAELAALFPDLIVKMKPNFSQPLVGELFDLIANCRSSEPPLPLAAKR